MTAEQIQHLKSLLETERDNLARRWHPSVEWEELPDMQAADMMDRVDVDSSRDRRLLAESGDKQKWMAVNDALARIEKGTYGICQDCGEEIAFPRLEAFPTAELCVNCQRQREMHETVRYTPRPAKPVILRGESAQDLAEEE